MLIIPAIDLKDGKCVQLVQGVFGSEQVVRDDILEVAQEFYAAGIKRLHVIDLNAAVGKGDNLGVIAQILKKKQCPVEVGGGIRDIDKAKQVIKNGADFVIIGTAGIKDPSFLKGLVKDIGKEKIIVALDYKNRKVLSHGWTKATGSSPIELAIKLKEFCCAFLVTCVDKEGQLKGPDFAYLKELREKVDRPIIASGGISSLDDLKKLKRIGVFGAVIGMALYKGNIDLKKAVKTI